MTFTTSNSSGIFSDDFSTCAVDDRWTWINPLNDSTSDVNGRQLEMTVPGGDGVAAHTLYTDGIYCAAADAAIERRRLHHRGQVRFGFGRRLARLKGIVIEEDGNTFLRLEFYKRPKSH